jgi:D-alanyl-lipoteichoic acid acyltransferase DltB (MBOAT superfamily)
MNSRWLHEYSIQTVLASMQIVVILLGFMATGLILKGAGYPDIGVSISGKLYFVRHFGALLLIVPIVWVFATIAFERRPDNRFSKRWTIVTGIVVLAALSYFLFLVAGLAISLESGNSHGVILES